MATTETTPMSAKITPNRQKMLIPSYLLPPSEQNFREKNDPTGSESDNDEDVNKVRRMPGFHPVNEWQITRIPLEGENGKLSLGVMLRLQGMWASQMIVILKRNNIPHLRDSDPIDPQHQVFKFDPDAYPLVQKLITQNALLNKNIRPLPDELLTVLDRQSDTELISTLSAKELESRWAEVPTKLANELRPFQKEGVEFLWTHQNRGMIADEMGLGKTIQAITFLLSSKRKEDWPALIVAPRTVRYNWKTEWLKWCPGAKESDVMILSDTKMCERILPLLVKQQIKTQKEAESELSQDQSGATTNDKSGKKRSIVDDTTTNPLKKQKPVKEDTKEDEEEDEEEEEEEEEEEPLVQKGKKKRTKSGSSNDKKQKVDEPVDEKEKKKRVTKKMLKHAEEAKIADGSPVGKIFIISYHLLIRKTVLALLKLVRFASIVFDESHSLKHITSHRTKASLELSRYTQRLVLLSGTPASRPAELFPQVKMIHPWMFLKWWIPYPKFITSHEKARAHRSKAFTFAARYCDPKPVACRGPRGVVWRWQTEKGVCRLSEISSIVQHYIFIRRLKRDVLKQMPKLNRTRMVLVPSETELEKAQEDLDKLQELEEGTPQHERAFMDIFDKKLPKLKWPLVEAYIREQFSEGALAADPSVKVLIFANHHYFLHNLDRLLTEIQVPHILMYGETSSEKREEGTKKFQTRPVSECRVAILGIKPFKEGVNFDKASKVIMAELLWGPEDMLQAECRAHRLNSERVVDVEYLLVKNTMDMIIWGQLDKKQTQADVMMDQTYLQDPKRASMASLPSRYVVNDKNNDNNE